MQPQKVVIILDRGRFGRWSRDLAISHSSISFPCLPRLPPHCRVAQPAGVGKREGMPSAHVPSMYLPLRSELSGVPYDDIPALSPSRDGKSGARVPACLPLLLLEFALGRRITDSWATLLLPCRLGPYRFRTYQSHLNIKQTSHFSNLPSQHKLRFLNAYRGAGTWIPIFIHCAFL